MIRLQVRLSLAWNSEKEPIIVSWLHARWQWESSKFTCDELMSTQDMKYMIIINHGASHRLTPVYGQVTWICVARYGIYCRGHDVAVRLLFGEKEGWDGRVTLDDHWSNDCCMCHCACTIIPISALLFLLMSHL